MIKKTLYPKTKRLWIWEDVTITEKLDWSNLWFFNLWWELYIAQRNNIYKASEKFRNTPCFRPATALNINSNGDIVLCCGDLFGEVVMGNINKESMQEIWENSNYKYYRKKLETNRVGLKLCEDCNHDGRGHKRDV